MTIDVAIPALSCNLTTLARVKAYLRETGTENDSLLSMMLAPVSTAIAGDQHVAGEAGTRPLVRQSYTERRAGDGGFRLDLSRWPLDPASVVVTINDELVTDFVVERSSGPARLYRRGRWPRIGLWPGVEGEYNITVNYTAGYLFAPMVATWTANTGFSLGAWARPTAPRSLRYECTTAGISHATTEPTWPTTAGQTVTDGTVTWTAREAAELLSQIEELAWVSLQHSLDRGKVPAFVASDAVEGASTTYFSGARETNLPKSVKEGCKGWRRRL